MVTSEQYDFITGVFSRSLLSERMDQEVGRSLLGNFSVSLLMLDIDHFKSINDAFGHSRGDQALAEVAGLIKSQIRQTDEVFRYGGDEFVVLLPETNKHQAAMLATRILNHINESRLSGEPPIMLSVSIGVANYPEDAESASELFEKADRRHYKSKELGRARITTHEGESVPFAEGPSPSRLIERDHSLSLLKNFLDTDNEQPYNVLRVTGKKGVGHTRFLEEARSLFSLRGYASLKLGGTPGLQLRVRGAVSEALRDWEPTPKHLSGQGVSQTAAQLIEQKKLNGLVILIDDWQSLDPHSREVIHYLLNGSGLPRVIIMYTDDGNLPVPLPQITRDKIIDIYLYPISDAGVRIWLRNVIRQELPNQVLQLIAEMSEGLPTRLSLLTRWLDSEHRTLLDVNNIPSLLVRLEGEFSRILKEWENRRASIPASLPTLFGREDEITLLKKTLSEKPIVALVGTNGIGKTRLALQSAIELLDHFDDGVHFISFENFAASQLFAVSIAHSLKIKLDPRLETFEQLLEQLSTKKILLILDGFDKVMDEALLLEQIAERAPSVKILITATRSPGLTSVRVIEVGGLPFPHEQDPHPENFPAVQLFLERARFTSNAEPDLVSIGRICRLLDGSPLGIEIASTWVNTLTCEQIAQHIEKNLSFLTSNEKIGPRRSLTAVFDSVFDMFSATEIRTLISLGIFKGGFSREAAAQVTGASPFFLDALAAKLLIHHNGPKFFRSNGPFALYLLEKLRADPPLLEEITSRFLTYYLDLLKEYDQSNLQHTNRDILPEVDNLRNAWSLALDSSALIQIEPLLPVWMTFLRNRGWFHEAIESLTAVDSKCAGDRSLLIMRVGAKNYLGEFYYHLGRHLDGITALNDGLSLLRENGLEGTKEQASIYLLLANNYGSLGWHVEAKDICLKGMEIAEKAGELSLAFQFANTLGVGEYLVADYPNAILYTRLALDMAIQLYDNGKIVQALNNLGNMLYESGDIQQARLTQARALEYLPGIDGLTLKASVLDTMGNILTASGEYESACRQFLQGLNLIRDIDAAPLAVEMLVGLAELLNRMGERSLALSFATVLAGHPAAAREVGFRVDNLLKELSTQPIEPSAYNWSPNQIPTMIEDAIHILEEKLK